MPFGSRQRDAALVSQRDRTRIGYFVTAAAALLCIVLVINKLPDRQDSLRTSNRVSIEHAKSDVYAPNVEGDHAPAQPLPNLAVDDRISTAELRDCWTQNYSIMAGAPPCASSGAIPVEGNAKVAIMFLVKSVIPTEPIWTAFIASAAELKLRMKVATPRPKPAQVLPEIVPPESDLTETCWRHGGPLTHYGVPPRADYLGPVPPAIKNVTGWLQSSCQAELTGAQLYQTQDLYSIYIHRSVGFPSAPEDSVFAGRDIEKRIRAEFAQPSLISAYKNLLEEALKDKRNSMFLLVSETCVPLHHPALIWAQLIAESHISRVSDGTYSGIRWSELMATDYMHREHFQKGGQWHTLTRMHADLVVNDRHVWSQFERFCKTQKACGQVRAKFGHVCVADEHFVPTMFAVYGMDESRDGIGELTYTDWLSAQGSWHPKTFYPGDVLSSIYAMRLRTQFSKCPRLAHTALRSAATLFQHSTVCRAAGDHVSSLAGPNLDETPSINTFSRRLLVGHDNLHLGDSAVEEDDANGSDSDAGTHHAAAPAALRIDAPAMNGGTASQISATGASRGVLEEAENGEGGVGLLRLEGRALSIRRQRNTEAAILYRQQQKQQKETWRKQPQQQQQRPTTPGIPEFGPARDLRHVHRSAAIHEAMLKNLRATGWLGDFEPMQMHCPLLGRRVSWQAVSEFASVAWRCDGLGFAWECLHPDAER